MRLPHLILASITSLSSSCSIDLRSSFCPCVDKEKNRITHWSASELQQFRCGWDLSSIRWASRSFELYSVPWLGMAGLERKECSVNFSFMAVSSSLSTINYSTQMFRQFNHNVLTFVISTQIYMVGYSYQAGAAIMIITRGVQLQLSNSEECFPPSRITADDERCALTMIIKTKTANSMCPVSQNQFVISQNVYCYKRHCILEICLEAMGGGSMAKLVHAP